MATMKTLNGYGFNATEFNGKAASDYLQKTDTATNSAKLGGKTLAEIMLDLYPVGAVYISVNSTSPASLFGGTWESIGGRFLLGADSTYTAGSTGGEATHTLVISEMPNHAHDMNMISKESASAAPNFAFNYQYTSSEVLVGYTNTNGGGNPHNNMPPYLAVNMWKRVS